MGMTYEQFWEQDCKLVVPYRKAFKIRQDQINNTAWLNGLYIWKALQCAPIFVNGFMPRGARVEPYFEKPIDFTPEKKKPRNRAEENERKTQETIGFMNMLMNRFNQQNKRNRQEKENALKQQEQDGPPGKE